MQTGHPELHRPGKVSPGSDRMRHQRGSLRSRLLAFSSEALAVLVLQPLNNLALQLSGTLSLMATGKSVSETRSFALSPPTRMPFNTSFCPSAQEGNLGILKGQSPTSSE